jgi:outer membrane protein OmpA-like peptidoglycan-associated protein
MEKTVEVGLPVAEARFVVTNGGADVRGKAQVYYLPAGHHDGATIAWADSGNPVRLPEGTYDVHVVFVDGAARKNWWIDNQSLAGKVDKTADAGLPVAEVRFVVTNGGADVKGKAQVHYLPAGHHDGATIAWVDSGNPARLPEGTYDVHVVFVDGAARKDLWIDNQSFAGKVEKSIEIGSAVTAVRVVVTNGGADVKGKAQVYYLPAGHHDGATIAWSDSGNPVRLPEGTYDVHVIFVDGAARKDLWLDNQRCAGTAEKTVEIGLPVAQVRTVITNDGVDVAGKGQAFYFPAGHHDGPATDWKPSGEASRLADGTYDVDVRFRDGFIRKDLWLDGQSLTGMMERTVELSVRIAEPTVTVTQNGVDVGDKAVVAYSVPAVHAEIGSLRSGQPARLEAGTYDIHAVLFGAEGWLRGAVLTGKPALTIELRPLRAEQLRVNGPPPTACTIEVYGVNFDFDKAVPRPDSEPVLKQVLALFTREPGFSAEVGGHTDNAGTPEYNLKLSDARALAVKSWLVEHKVAVARVASHGYGDTRPLVPNTTDENRSRNRRVELRTAGCR